MSKGLPDHNPDKPGTSIKQNVEGSSIDGGIQGLVGDHNVQTQDNRQITQIFHFSNEESSNYKRSDSEKRLLGEVSRSVNGRIEQSLHSAIFINLHKEELPDKVDRPWSSEIKIGDKSPELIPPETALLDIFNQDHVSGRLLIIGTPGSGKTTTMLDLARELLEYAKQDQSYPIPVPLSLSSWKDNRQSISKWLLSALKQNYGVTPRFGKELIENCRLLPMLDGLDEVAPGYQEGCVKQINKWLVSGTRPIGIVVCSRSEEYSNLTSDLTLNACISLKPLTNEQIHGYLTQVTHVNFWFILSQDRDLLDLIRSPFLLSLLVLTYSNISPKELKNLTDSNEKFNYLLQAFVRQMLSRKISSQKEKLYSPRQTLYWLHWLAKQCNENFRDEFLIEQMQPFLLGTRRKEKMYQVAIGVLFALIDGLIFAIIATPVVGVIVGIVIGTIVAVSDKPVSTYRATNISTIETFQISISRNLVQEISTHLKQNLIIGSSIGLVIGLIWLTQGGLFGLIVSSMAGMLFGLLGGLVFGLIGGLRTDIETRKVPNQGIWASAKNVPILLLLVYPICVLLDILFFLIIEGTPIQWDMSFIRGIAWASIFAFGTSGKACMQHVVLRLLLYSSRNISWNYAQFLNTCTERSLLQRIGGSYRFPHRLLREYISNIDPKKFPL